jgi:hypothetical protein
MWLISNKRNRTESWPIYLETALKQLKIVHHSPNTAQKCCQGIINTFNSLNLDGDRRKIDEFDRVIKDIGLEGEEFIRLGQQWAVKSPEVATAWCGALSIIMDYQDEFGHLITASHVSTDKNSSSYDIYSILCDILKSHPTQQEVICVACKSIGNLSDSCYRSSRERFLQQNICEILSNILETQKKSQSVMTQCCWAVSILAVSHDSTIQNEFAAKKACTRLVNVLQLYEFTDSKLLHAVASAICNLSARNRLVKQLFMESGVCELLVSILRRLQNESTFDMILQNESILNAIFNLSRMYGCDDKCSINLKDSLQERFEKAGLLDVLRNIIKQNKDGKNSSLCRNILEEYGIHVPDESWSCVVS